MIFSGVTSSSKRAKARYGSPMRPAALMRGASLKPMWAAVIS